ncbi:MAG TPA: GNAT family N-acetyltransferase [Streptosporangiaceae bacterium]|jgi:RimJ/RimL family protein N-acetyltransferase|nr:GNAT family N-acetyltransferase [Streptosporangiaceae bacterium]
MEVLVRPAAELRHGDVTLRRWRVADAGLAYDLVGASLEHLRPWMSWAAEHSPEGSLEYLRGCERDWDSGAAFNYLISEHGVPCGSAGLMARIGPGGLEIGYWVARDRVGRGIATAAAAALTEAAFGLPGIDRTEIVHDLSNAASGQIPRKLGYARVGTAVGRFPKAPGECGTSAIWRLVRPAAG